MRLKTSARRCCGPLHDTQLRNIRVSLQVEIPACGRVVREALSCCNVSSSEGASAEHAHHRRLSGGASSGGGGHSLCLVGQQSELAAACDEHKYPW